MPLSPAQSAHSFERSHTYIVGRTSTTTVMGHTILEIPVHIFIRHNRSKKKQQCNQCLFTLHILHIAYYIDDYER